MGLIRLLKRFQACFFAKPSKISYIELLFPQKIEHFFNHFPSNATILDGETSSFGWQLYSSNLDKQKFFLGNCLRFIFRRHKIEFVKRLIFHTVNGFFDWRQTFKNLFEVKGSTMLLLIFLTVPLHWLQNQKQPSEQLMSSALSGNLEHFWFTRPVHLSHSKDGFSSLTSGLH